MKKQFLASVVAVLLAVTVLFAASFTETFPGADAGSLGGNWTDIQNGMQVVSHRADPETFGSDSVACYTGVSYSDDQFIQSTATAGATSNPYWWGVIVRGAASAGTPTSGYQIVGGSGYGDTKLVRWPAGSQVAAFAGDAIVNGDVIRLEISGYTMVYKHNGSTVTPTSGSMTDGSATYSTGAACISGQFGGFDDHTNVSGGDLGGSPPPATPRLMLFGVGGLERDR